MNALRRAYRRLGPRYPRVVVALQFQLAHVVVLLGIGLLALYQPLSTTDAWRLILTSQLVILVDNLLDLRAMSQMLRPVDTWLRGERGAERTRAAWLTLANMPGHFLRRRLGAVVLMSIPWCVYATAELGLGAANVLVLFAGALIATAYGGILRFFGLELTMRPVLEDVARDLPDGVAPPPAGVPLRWKLLAGLPLISVVTGVAVAGLTTSGEVGLTDLGVDILIAIAVAFSISLELTLLLSRSIMAPIDDLRDATRRLGEGDFSVRVPLVSTDEVGGLAQAFNQAVAGLEERERLREAFGSYVDPRVADQVLEQGAVVEGDEVDVSVLFLDIRDFTAFAERSSARTVVQTLNEFWEAIVPVITRQGGHANKFIGDGLLAVFGAPVPRRDHADRALDAALAIARLVDRRYGGELRIGIGINSGRVVAGTVGGGGRLEFTVIGDVVNTASRVEQCTRTTGDDVLLTDHTRRALSEAERVEPRRAMSVRGKSEPIALYAPASVRDEAGPKERRTPATAAQTSG